MPSIVPAIVGIGGMLVGDALSPDVPDYSGAAKETADANKEISKWQIDLSREQFEWNKENVAELMPFIKGIYESQAAIGTANEARAQELHEYWQTTYKPLEEALVAEAEEYNTEAKRQQLATRAGTDVATAYAGLQGQLERSLGRYGINPNSNRFAALNAGLMRDEALQTAGAMTDARQKAEDLGWAKRVGVAGLGRGLPNAADSAYGVAINAGNSAVGNATVPAQMVNAGYGAVHFGANSAANTNYKAGLGYGTDWSARLGQYNAESARFGDIFALGGSVAGIWKADGGPIDGPGGPKDDAIPARLSKGEYVVPEAVVRKVGVEHFEKMIAKYGDAGNKEALAVRKGLTRRS